MKHKVLVLEDEESIRTFTVINLKRQGYEVLQAETGEEALELYDLNRDISIALLDVMLPGIDGFEVCRGLRALGFVGGVIMLTARVQDDDKVTGLMTGADDYVTKPFSVTELLARVLALLRRVSGEKFSDDTISSGVFKLSMRSRELLKNGVKIDLTQIEFALMKMFLSNKGKALSRDDILKIIWGNDYSSELKIVDVNIRRLRMKIEDDPGAPKYLTAIRGFGYIWE